MLTPQECFEKFEDKKYIEENIKFLKPLYRELYKGLGNPINYSRPFFKKINSLKQFFKNIYKLKEKYSFSADNIQEFREKIEEKNSVRKTAEILNDIIIEIAKKRSNVNDITAFLWLVLGIKSKDQYKDLISNIDIIYQRLLSVEVLSVVLKFEYYYFETIINDLQLPLELINPTRRKGLFDRSVLKKIRNDLSLSNEYNRAGTNWIIYENKIKNLFDDRILSQIEDSKIPDFLGKINRIGFIAAHKEQNMAGGGQDNQINDAKKIFGYLKQPTKNEVKQILNVDTLLAIIIHDGYSPGLQSGRHWENLYDKINEAQNSNKYLINSVIFKELILNLK